MKLNILLFTFIFFQISAYSQLDLFLVDSSQLTDGKGSIGAKFIKKNGKVKLSESAGGSVLMGGFNVVAYNCQLDRNGDFEFELHKLYKNDLIPVFTSFKRSRKYLDTLFVPIPRVSKVQNMNQSYEVFKEKSIVPDYMIGFDNGTVVNTVDKNRLRKILYYEDLPMGFYLDQDGVRMDGHHYYDSVRVKVNVLGHEQQFCITVFKPNYVYTISINGKGSNGEDGSKGSRGNDGSPGSTRLDGTNGDRGDAGGRGNNGMDVEIHFMTLPSGIVKATFNCSQFQDVYYLDFKNGAALVLDLTGGNGGNGGKGGKGGSGANAYNGYVAGYGGNGGEGGRGGNGGRGGHLTVYTDKAASNYLNQITLNNKGGYGGKGGEGGNAGTGGKNENATFLDLLLSGRRGSYGSYGANGYNGEDGKPIKVIILP